MLLLDGNTQEVFEVNDSLVNIADNHEPTRIRLAEFEMLAFKPEMRTRIGRMLRMNSRGPVSLRLCNSVVVWAMRFKVVNDGELPIPEREFGDDFVVVWPASTSINAFFELQEAARRAETQLALPRPTFGFVPKQGTFGILDVPLAKRVDVRDLTVAQRIFGASMSMHATPFPRRQSQDTWATRMERMDLLEFEQLRDRRRVALRGAARETPEAPATSAPIVVPPRVGGFTLLALPDEVLGVVVAQRLQEAMHSAKTVHETVYALMLVARQFRRAVIGAVGDVQMRVHEACLSLFGPSPMRLAQVQRLLSESGLTVRASLTLTDRHAWYRYVRARYAMERGRRPVVVHGLTQIAF